LFFSVFSIQNIENKENAKYSIKNNISESALFFLATKNHRSASTISISILRLIASIRCIAWLPGSLFLPLKKMYSVSILIAKKQRARITISLKPRSDFDPSVARYPAKTIRAVSIERLITFFLKVSKKKVHFRKSLIAV
jgi:hypothetical protein